NRPRDFRHHDVVRAFRAARAAGVENPSVRIRTPTGTEYFFGGEVKADVPKIRGKLTIPVRSPDTVGKGDLSGSKVQAPLARGGKTPMFGKNDRTNTSPADAANPQRAGVTGHRTGDKKLAKNEGVGGVSRTARPGQTGC